MRFPQRVARACAAEFLPANVRLHLGLWLCKAMPAVRGVRLRVRVLRAAGVDIGHGTLIGGSVRIEGSPRPSRNLRIGTKCWINSGCLLDTSAAITIGNGVSMAQDVMILTGTHDIGSPEFRAGSTVLKPVQIGHGCWLGARSVILPGVSVGNGAIVAAGAVVTDDVPENSLVAGVPAQVVRKLPHT